MIEGWMILLFYIVGGIFGFAGGIFGYYFAKKKDQKKAEKEKPTTISVPC